MAPKMDLLDCLLVEQTDYLRVVQMGPKTDLSVDMLVERMDYLKVVD